MVGHDALGDGEAEAGALPRRLGGEERIEDARQHVLGDARPLVDEGDLDLPGRAEPRTHDERAASLHGLERVGGEAEDDLPELSLVGDDLRHLRRQLGEELARGEARLVPQELEGLGRRARSRR